MATAHGQTLTERDRLIVRPEVLAEAEATMEIDWDGNDATLRTVVSVHKCPLGYRSRLGYHATLYFTEAGGIEREIGYIIAWRLSKPTGVNPNIDARYYLDDWYTKSYKSYNRDSGPLAACVWAFYGPGSFEGDNYDQVVDEEKKNELGDNGNELVFFQTIYIKFREDPDDEDSEYSRQGLGPMYLDLYYRILGGKILPAWFSLSGAVTYLLIPRLPTEAPVNELWLHLKQSNGWSDKQTAEKAKDSLSKIFKDERYGFETYVDNVRVFETPIVSVLGRVVEPEDTISEPGDRLLLTAAESSSG